MVVNLEKQSKEGFVVIQVKEDKLDSSLAPEFKKELLATAVQDSPNIIIDVSRVGYMDSSGLGSLLFAHRQAIQNGGNFVIIKPNAKIKKLIDIAQLSRVLFLCDSESDAVHLIQEMENGNQ